MHRDQHIEVAKALYSIPGNLIGETVEVTAARSTPHRPMMTPRALPRPCPHQTTAPPTVSIVGFEKDLTAHISAGTSDEALSDEVAAWQTRRAAITVDYANRSVMVAWSGNRDAELVALQ